jgi:hypothetical protein
MSIDYIIREVEGIVNTLMSAHPAIIRVVITDYQGMIIAKNFKTFNYDPKEEKSPNPAIPLLNSILENSEKFLGFLKVNATDVFVFSWLFEKQYIFAASSPYGFIGLFCEPDVDMGWIKRVLKEQTRKYNQLMRSVFTS